MDAYFEDQCFDGNLTPMASLGSGTYENCRFVHIDLSGGNLQGFALVDCRFEHCNLSNCKLDQTRISDCHFEHCKLIGNYFDQCSPAIFSAAFSDSQLDLSGFHGLNLKNCRFSNCSLQEVDFTRADLSGLVLDQCNLAGAQFDQTRLEGTDFSTAYHYRLDPAGNYLKKARFALAGLPGLLDQYGIIIQ